MSCGVGTNVLRQLIYGVDAYGIDPEEWKIEFINLKLKEFGYPEKWKEHFFKGYGENLPFENECFDCVTSLQTLEHVQDYRKCIYEMLRVIKKDGICFIRCPNYDETNNYEGHYLLEYPLNFNKDKFIEYLKEMGKPIEMAQSLNFITHEEVIKTLNQYQKYHGDLLINDLSSRNQPPYKGSYINICIKKI